MYEKDKSQRITLRLNQTQFDFVKENSDMLGVSPSDFLRMVINATLATSKMAQSKLANNTEERAAFDSVVKSNFNDIEGKVMRRENEQTDINDIV